MGLALKWIDIHLKYPYIYQGKMRDKKRSALLCFKAYQAECSVYPGLHTQSEPEIEEALQDLSLPWLPDHRFENLDQIISELKKRPMPSQGNLLFAYESLLFHLWSDHDILPPELQLLSKEKTLSAKIQKLITTPEQLLENPNTTIAQTIKYKFGRSSHVQEDIALFKKIQAAHPKMRWRIDANEAYSSEDLIAWQNECDSKQLESIDYFENPCVDPTQWPKNCQLPLALETGPQTNPLWWTKDLPLKALVHKPSVNDGFFQTLHLLIHSKIPVILSSTFEGPLGLRDLLYLVHLSRSNQTHGLGTYEHIALDSSCPMTSFQLIQKQNELTLVSKTSP